MRGGLGGNKMLKRPKHSLKVSGMVSRLQYSLNLFTNLLKSNNEKVAGNHTGLNYFYNSMGRCLDEFNKEFIKNTMLKHEEVFKQQVHELHRLYQVQKLLMAELRTEEMTSLPVSSTNCTVASIRNKIWSSESTSQAIHPSHERAMYQVKDSTNCESALLYKFADLDDNQCTGRHSSFFRDSLKNSKGSNVAHPVEGNCEELRPGHECNLDLTLTIGWASDKKRKNSNQIQRETAQSIASTLSTPVRHELDDLSAGSSAESLKRPHWPFQALSLNRS
ncbi:hypothetical protein HPP92_017747 [Vanilla planifolia]|uniref:Uncharacterized protein n=1 Tax=Vanilla planifolia TaxID=51239 RepID=A0A835QF21_VANPL|nr:hypothetical protein HPP92_018370 [Vanilla planifolia]KAG0468419.1 hypothetical protein HPP92_017747 [Vanilla planifolia]